MLSNTPQLDDQGLTEDENMIEFNYNNIVSQKEKSTELSVINDFVHLRKENISLLKHPLLQAMIMMKWKTFQFLWLIELVLQFLFTILMFRIGVLVLKIEPNNCGNLTWVQHRQEDYKDFDQDYPLTIILASILWIFYALVEISQFSFSVVEIVENMKTRKGIFGQVGTIKRQKEKEGCRKKISNFIRNFYFPIPHYLKEMENWLQLLIITIR